MFNVAEFAPWHKIRKARNDKASRRVNKKLAWLAMTASKYAGKQEDTSDEADELESQ